MPLSSAKFSVDGTAVELVESGGNYEATIHVASGTVYLGDATVTSTTGYKMDNGDKIQVTCPDGSGLYAISASGTQTVYVLKIAL